MGSVCEQKRSVVLIPLPFQGHMTPMLQLGSILHSKGFSIIVAHSEVNAPNPLNHPEFCFLPLADNLSSFDTSFFNLLNLVKSLNKNCKEPLANYMVEMMKDQELHGQTSIVYDSVMYFAEDVAAYLKIPSMVLHTTCAANIQSYHVMLRLEAENYFPLLESQLQDPVPQLHSFRFKDLPVPVSCKIPDFILHIFALDVRSSVAIIWNTTEELEYSSLKQIEQHYKVPCFSIGPFHKLAPSLSTSFLKEDTDCIAWLDKQAPHSVLYVSIGSLATIDESELEEAAWGLANSGQTFLWVIRPSSVNGSKWVERLPEGVKEIVGERGQIVKWAPQKKVLAHPAVGGFWSHCGWNSTLESISEAVPMICRPCFSDQMMNARYLTHVWKVGLQMEHVTRGFIERTIRRLMVDNEGKELRQRMLHLKQRLDASVQKDGSSYRSLNDLTKFIHSFPLQK